MKQQRLVPLMISLPRAYRDQLRKMAAERNIKNTEVVISAALIGREIICKYLDDHENQLALPEGEPKAAHNFPTAQEKISIKKAR